jgi:ATP-dependent protease ClpP protease subunit
MATSKHSKTNDNPLIELLKSGKEKKQSTSFTHKPTSHIHEYYLVGEIGESNQYTEWFDEIRHASPDDVVKIYINSCGGDLWTAIQFMRVIRECRAPVVASVEGACMSAATIVFLMSDSFEISPHSMFMFHNYSGGTVGKGGEMVDQIYHERKWSSKLLAEIYANFLKKEEINAILDNKDIWMEGEEVAKRLKGRQKILSKAKNKESSK